MQASKPSYHLLFIVPIHNEMTLLGYTNERVEVMDMAVEKFFRNKGAIKQKGYKAAIYFDGMYLYPTAGQHNPNCCWIHIDAICGKDIVLYSQMLQQYKIDITVEKILKIYMRSIQNKKNDVLL